MNKILGSLKYVFSFEERKPSALQMISDEVFRNLYADDSIVAGPSSP